MGRVINAESFPVDDRNIGWIAHGYFGDGNHELVDSLKGQTAIVAGSGGAMAEIREQVDAAVANTGKHTIFAVNDVGVYLPLVDHLVSLHADNLVHWTRLRADKHDRARFKTHSRYDAEYNWNEIGPVMFALSGYFAMQLALIMGAEQIILCGCPGDNTPRFFDATPKADYRYPEKGVIEQVENECRRVPELKEKVRSMSGWTKEFFGGI